MEITLNKEFEVSAREVLAKIKDYYMAAFVEILAERYDKDFKTRAQLASKFADGISEQGARFLADVVAHHVARRKP